MIINKTPWPFLEDEYLYIRGMNAEEFAQLYATELENNDMFDSTMNCLVINDWRHMLNEASDNKKADFTEVKRLMWTMVKNVNRYLAPYSIFDEQMKNNSTPRCKSIW